MGREDSSGSLGSGKLSLIADAPPNSAARPELDYAPTPPLYRRRWVLRWAVLLVLLLLAVFWLCIGSQWLRNVRYELARKRAERAARLYTPPTTQHVVYDDDPQTYPPLLRGGGGYVSTCNTISARKFAAFDNAAFDQLVNAGTGRVFTLPVAFLHELTSPKGNRRLVAVQMLAVIGADPLERFIFTPNVPLAPTTPTATGFAHRSEDLVMYRAPGAALRVYDGLVDANDASRFVFVVEHNGQKIDVRGQLLDDGKIVLTPTVGQVADFRSELSWIPLRSKIPKEYEPSCFVNIATTKPTQYLGPCPPGTRTRIDDKGVLVQEFLQRAVTIRTTAPALPY